MLKTRGVVTVFLGLGLSFLLEKVKEEEYDLILDGLQQLCVKMIGHLFIVRFV